MTSTELLWLRRDLRVHDHPALTATAERADELTCLFVADPAILERGRLGAPRHRQLLEALDDLADALARRGNRLVLARGAPTEAVPDLARRLGAETVRWTDDVTPSALRRDAAVARALAADGRHVAVHDGVCVHPPGSVRTDAGLPYRVFTPFLRRWRALPAPEPLPAPARLPAPPEGTPPSVPAAEAVGRVPAGPWPRGGQSAARQRLTAFLDGPVDRYHELRDRLDLEGTSRLSADLHLGCLSAREVRARLDTGREGDAAFEAELAWRDFYAHVIAAWPEVATVEFDPAWRGLPWGGDGPAVEAWRAGRTGVPIVDAAMRELAATGWMHNRARMIVASFLCKDLRVDWRIGEEHFLRGLIDGDVASNNGGWQWAAGTGADAQPWFRVFNPARQGRRFDPDGDYVRRWVPELAAVPAPRVHDPAGLGDAAVEAGVRLGADYPRPIVDHAEERERTLAWFKAHRRG